MRDSSKLGMTRNLVIVGAGGLGRELLVLVRQLGEARPAEAFNMVGWLDDGRTAGTTVDGYPVLGGVRDYERVATGHAVVLGIGDPATKKMLVETFPRGTKFPVLVHPTVQLAPHQQITLGEGCVIAAGTVLTTNIKLGRHVFLNLNCTVGHDAEIGDFCAFMPAVNISGECQLGESVYFGTGALIINRVKVGSGTIVGAGAVVTRDLPGGVTAVGMPARPLVKDGK